MRAARFARLPEEVLSNPLLRHADKIVYAALVLCLYKGNIVRASQRTIAEIACVHRRQVRRSLDALAKTGAIAISIHRFNRCNIYQLNSHLFHAPKNNLERGQYVPLQGGQYVPPSR